jgi:hypothetical protein
MNSKGGLVTPYYADGNCTIYKADCDDVLPSLDRFDLLLTEAPKYPPGLSDDNKARMDSGLKVAAQSNRIGALPEKGLQIAIEICDNAIVWRPDRFKLPIGKTLEWFCNNHQFSSAWHRCNRKDTQDADPDDAQHMPAPAGECHAPVVLMVVTI